MHSRKANTAFLSFITILINGINPIPIFDPTALFKDILIPADAAVNSVIYRIRASDPNFDYPLIFDVLPGSGIVDIDGLNCSRFNSVCQANVILKKRLEPDRFYDFTVRAKNQHDQTSFLNCSFKGTNAATPIEKIFPGAPSLLSISENARRNTELGTILARGNENLTRSVLLELWGSPQFGLHQRLVTEKDSEGTILLLSSLDYEQKSVHHLTVLANDPWTNQSEDTRNIAGWPLLIAVLDEQDTPPVFTIAPPTTILNPNLKAGDLILRVHAQDGDRGNPREIRYNLNSENDGKFFEINEETGELYLTSQLTSHSNQPILLNITAEEVRSNPNEAPAQSTSVQLALIPPGNPTGTPMFANIEYNTLLNENSPSGTVLDLVQAEINAPPGEFVTLELEQNNGTFEISPNVVEGNSKFKITVHDNKLLDYEERKLVHCFIVAKEVGSTANNNNTAKAKLTVILNDVNDNAPKFSKNLYNVNIQENSAPGTSLLQVEATDVDTGIGGRISYTKLTGESHEIFELNPETGLITVKDSLKLDAELNPVLTLKVEAADEDGDGLTATANIIINIVDINDNNPVFEKSIYEFILDKNRIDFTLPAFIKAIDADLTAPNNEVNYEIINLPENLYLNERTGEIVVKKYWNLQDLVTLKGRVYDGGIPRKYGECEIRIYPPESREGKVIFIIPGKYQDKESVTRTLRNLTRNRIVSIDRVREYNGYEPGATDITSDYDKDKTVVEATVTYSRGSIVDLSELGQIYQNGRTENNNNYKEKEVIKEIRQSRSDGLLWFLILFFILLLLAIITLILCCICKQCPLYAYFFERNKKKTPQDVEYIEKITVPGSGRGKETKSVQATARIFDVETESLHKCEYDRNSEVRQPELQREQIYVREGNADILRLITRGTEQRPLFLNTENYDSGKDILMQRYIEQQQQQVLLPNAVNRLQQEHEMLENSLRQQNAILRQILLERERDLRLETQSLPAGTQTDQNVATQTEERQVQTDKDDSNDDDDEIAIVKARVKRRNGQKFYKKRKIKTPIQEEVELDVVEREKESKPKYKHTRTSEMRQRNSEMSSQSSKSGIRKDVLREITATLEPSDDESVNELFSEDSLEISPRSTTDSNKQKYHSEIDLRQISARSSTLTKSQSNTDLTKIKGRKVKKKTRGGSRYMEWYKNVKKDKQEEPAAKEKSKQALLLETKRRKKVESGGKKNGVGPQHPLLQHSEHRFEPHYVQPSEDGDSGIALAKPVIAQKKSVFTIAYDDMRTNQIRPDSTTSP